MFRSQGEIPFCYEKWNSKMEKARTGGSRFRHAWSNLFAVLPGALEAGIIAAL